MHLIGLKGLYRRDDGIVCLLFKDMPGFMSQPSMFLGMQASKRIWPSTPFGEAPGEFCLRGESDFWRRCVWSGISVSSNPIKPDNERWSLGLTATCLNVSFEPIASVPRSDMLLPKILVPRVSPFSWCLLWEKIMVASLSNLNTAYLYSSVWCL